MLELSLERGEVQANFKCKAPFSLMIFFFFTKKLCHFPDKKKRNKASAHVRDWQLRNEIWYQVHITTWLAIKQGSMVLALEGNKRTLTKLRFTTQHLDTPAFCLRQWWSKYEDTSQEFCNLRSRIFKDRIALIHNRLSNVKWSLRLVRFRCN